MSLDAIREENAFFRSQRRMNKRQANEDRKANFVLPQTKAAQAAQNSYFNRSQYANARARNVQAAMANGSFAKTRFAYNQANAGKAEMDGAGNISTRQAPKREAQFMPGPGGSMIPVKAGKRAAQQPQPSARQAPAPILGPRQQQGTNTNQLDLKPVGDPNLRKQIDEIKARQAQGKFFESRAPSGQATSPPARQSKTVGEMIADIDKSQAALRNSSAKMQEVFKPRTPPKAPGMVSTAKEPERVKLAGPVKYEDQAPAYREPENEAQKMARLQKAAEAGALSRRSPFQRMRDTVDQKLTAGFNRAERGVIAATKATGAAVAAVPSKIKQAGTSAGNAIAGAANAAGAKVRAPFTANPVKTQAEIAYEAAKTAADRAKRGPVYVPPTVQPGVKPQTDEERKRLAGL